MQQGLAKTFSEMSQGEQTLLRYQYLMQATSDAQGDFARTSGESFANMSRTLETNLTTNKEKIGSLLIGPISNATSVLNDFLTELQGGKERTVLDEIADINIDEATKIRQIEEIAQKAQGLIHTLDQINTNSGLSPDSDVIKYLETLTTSIGGVGDAINELPSDTSKGAAIASIADGANKLKTGQALVWGALYDVLKNVDGLDNIFSSDAAGNVSDLAAALSTDAPSEEKAAAWQTFLDALGSNAGALSALTGEDAQGAAAWMTAMKEALDKASIDPTNVKAWGDLLNIFAGGLSEDNKAQFNDAIIDSILALGNQSEYAREALAALGFESDDITKAQDRWLTICQQLVKTIPELSTIINTQTGEIQGGAEAVEKYVKAWKEENILQARIDALRQYRELLQQQLEVDNYTKIAIAENEAISKLVTQSGMSQQEASNFLKQQVINAGLTENTKKVMRKNNGFLGNLYAAALDLGMEAYSDLTGPSLSSDTESAVKSYVQAWREVQASEASIPILTQRIADEEANLQAQTGKSIDELNKQNSVTNETAESMSLLAKAANNDTNALNKYETALKSAGDALQAVADYQDKVRAETESTVRSLINGFGKIETPMQKARREFDDLGKAIEAAKANGEDASLLLSQQQANAASQISISSMTQGLESQLTYMREYQNMLYEARKKGVSEDLLATLSDGSQESFDYLFALTKYGGNIDELNKKYAEVQEEAERFTNGLTQQKLVADESYQSILEAAQAAVDGLDMGEAAYTNTAETVQAIANAIGDKSSEVKTQVDNILAQIARLNAASMGWNGFGAGFLGTKIIFSGRSHANGIDNVPYDGYLALLHQGERIQTAAEADLARRYSYQQPAFDYNAMGGAIGANIGRGNVYLDGKIVGNLISARQGNSYRALERSGWQG